MILLVDAEHTLVRARLTFLAWEADGEQFGTLEPMELLEAHEALDTRTFGFTPIAVVRGLVNKVIKHGAYVHPLLHGRLERGVLIDLDAVLMEVQRASNQSSPLVVLEFAKRPSYWLVFPITQGTFLVCGIEIRWKNAFDLIKVQYQFIVLVGLRNLTLHHRLGLSLLGRLALDDLLLGIEIVSRRLLPIGQEITTFSDHLVMRIESLLLPALVFLFMSR